MIKTDEESLICDFAETYSIYNYKSLPLKLVATLASGLSGDSRIKRKLSGLNHSIDTLLLACIVDRLSLLLWRDTKDASKGKNKPESLYELLAAVKMFQKATTHLLQARNLKKKDNEF